ncbi:MAG: DUF1028 domain-containing protein [Burkholderiaceae bacterium]
MTWSIIARDASGQFGVAVASKFFAVGALCAHTRRAVGALSTQALMNPLYGADCLDLLRQGLTAQQSVDRVVAADAGREQRQLHVLGASGAAAAHTGANCVDWCGHAVYQDFSVAGNMLAGPQVLADTADAFSKSAGLPLAERLLAAMAAGDAAGGDKRGKQSASLRIHGDEDYVQLDLRVDDHAEPILELHRIYQVSLERFQPFVSCLAGRHNPAGLTDRGEIDARIARFLAERAAPR